MFLFGGVGNVTYICKTKQRNMKILVAQPTSRKAINAELDQIAIKLKAISVNSDQYGNFEPTADYVALSNREDELMEVLLDFPM